MFGLSIFSPEILSKSKNDNTLVLIASGFQEEMIKQLEDMGYIYGKHILKVIDLPELMKDYSFVDRTGYIPLSDAEIKQSQLNVLKKAKQICEENGLRYYLAYGTLLGAVRHKGYIPWDDDIDIYIPIKDMKKFIEKVNEDKNFGIVSSCVEMDYYSNFSMMYDCNNICDSNHFPMQLTFGISIDIFPLFGLPDNKEEFNTPYGYNNYLKKRYGNYLELPPVEKRVGHHTFNAYHKL